MAQYILLADAVGHPGAPADPAHRPQGWSYQVHRDTIDDSTLVRFASDRVRDSAPDGLAAMAAACGLAHVVAMETDVFELELRSSSRRLVAGVAEILTYPDPGAWHRVLTAPPPEMPHWYAIHASLLALARRATLVAARGHTLPATVA